MADVEAPAGAQTQPLEVQEKGSLQKASAKGGGPISALPATLCGLSQIIYLSIAAVALIFFVIVLPVVLTLPEVVSCHSDDESYYVVKIDEPSIANVEPSMICIAESERKVKVTGAAFLDYNGAYPSVVVNEDSIGISGSMRGCSTLDVRGQDVQLCTEFDVIIANSTNLTNFSYYPFMLTDPVPPREHPLGDVTESPPCAVTAKGLLTVLPPPAIVDVTPAVICNATTMITISGKWFPIFTEIASHTTSKPLVELNSNLVSLSDLSLESCESFEANNYENCSVCDTIVATVNPLSFTINSAVTVSMQSPSPLNCSVPRNNNFVVVQRPSLSFVSPNIVCNDGVSAGVVTLNGANLLKVDGKHASYSLTVNNQTYPLSVQSDSGCTPLQLPMSLHNASLCSSVTVSIPPFEAPLGLSDASITIVTLATPECEARFSSMLYFAPKPTIKLIDPSSVCQGTQSNTTDTNLTLHAHGFSFLSYNSIIPSLDLNGAHFNGSQVLENCTASLSIPSSNGADMVQMCESLTIGLTYTQIDDMSIGGQAFQITQPQPISCSYNDSSSFFIIGPAKVYSINPSSLCAGEQNVLILNGSSLTANTSIYLQMNNTILYPAQKTYIDGQTLSVVFDSAGLTAGAWQLVAVNQGAGCDTTNRVSLTVKPKMFVFFVDPPVVYNGIPLQATIYTSGTDNANPATSLTFTRLNTGAGFCDNPQFTMEAACTAVYTDASCSNPALANQVQCEANNTWNGTDCSNPLLPSQAECVKINLWTNGFCSHPLLNVSECSQNNTWTFYDIGFCSNAIFSTATSCQQQNVWLGTKCSNPTLTTQASCEAINTWTFYSPGSCVGAPTLAYEECLSANNTWTELNTTEIYTSVTFNSSALTQKGSKIQVVIPAGFATGDWEITVVRSDGCQSTLLGGVNVVANTGLSLASVNPTRAWSLGNTAVTLKATATQNLQPGQVNFRSTPRVFLTPSGQIGSCTNSSGDVIDDSSTQAGCLALNGTFTPISALGVALAALVFEDSSTLQGIIQSHFCSGPYTTQIQCVNAEETWTELVVGMSYNLIVINPPPLSEVGVLSNAVVVVASPPPIVRSVVPDYVSGGSSSNVTCFGENFLYPATATITCAQPGAPASYSANSIFLVGVSSTEFIVRFVFPAATYLCQLQVTNADGNTFVYSSITTHSNANIVAFVASPYTLLQRRRGPEVVVASPAGTRKFMYVIGGDGQVASAAVPVSGITMVEYAPMAVNGTPGGSFVQQRYPLPAPVSHGRAAVMGRYIYYFGGYNTQTNKTSNAVYRAQILDPLNAPSLQLALNILANVTSNLTSGLWYYRVSAVFSDNSTAEYDYWSGPQGFGETSPSDVLSIRLPALQSMQLSLTWNAFPGASEYRLYRTPLSDRPSNQLGLLYQGPATNFQDLGYPVDLTQTPLPLGHLSHWAVLASLTTPRARHGLVVVPPTPSNPGQTCSYLIGGSFNWSDTSLSSTIESYCATVTRATSLTDTETHAMQISGSAYPNSFIGGWGYDSALITSTENPRLTNGRRMLLLSSRLPDNAEGGNVKVIEVKLDGTLLAQSSAIVVGLNPLIHGGFFASVGGEAFGLGGQTSQGYQSDGVSGKWDNTNTNITGPTWSNYGAGKLTQPAAYFGKMKFGPFLVVAGGCDGTAAHNTVQTSFCCS